jgi:cell division septation protein DedD
VVQVASFGHPDDAGVLQARLAKKGLEAYVQQANLGSKGIWYRVFVGPLASSTAAQQVAARLKAEEKLSPLVRKR